MFKRSKFYNHLKLFPRYYIWEGSAGANDKKSGINVKSKCQKIYWPMGDTESLNV